MILDITCPDCGTEFKFDNWDIDECPKCKKWFGVSEVYYVHEQSLKYLKHKIGD